MAVSRAGQPAGLEGAEAPRGPSRERPLTVGELLAAARRALDQTIRTTWVVGEVDSLNLHRRHLTRVLTGRALAAAAGVR